MLTTVFLLAILLATDPCAQQIYTWTDENGVTHLSDHAPPKNTNVKEVLNYKQKTPQEQAALEHRIEQERKSIQRQNQTDAAQRAELEARKAEKRAREAVEKAEEELRDNQKYVRKLSTRKWKRRKVRKKVERIAIETEASQAEAQSALKQAETAGLKAKQISEETIPSR